HFHKHNACPSSLTLSGEQRNSRAANLNVVQALFEYASLVDLEDWRNVCKLWYEESLSRWRRETWVKVSDNEDQEDGRLFLGKYMDLMDAEASFSEDDFYQFQKHPIRRFKFADCDLRTKIVAKEIDLARQAQFWQSIKLGNTGSELLHIIEFMSDIQDEVPWEVEKLDLLEMESMRLVYFRDDICDFIWRLQLPLTELSLDIGKKTWASTFKRILDTHAVTLRKLVVYRESGSGFENENGIVQYFHSMYNFLPCLSCGWLVLQFPRIYTFSS
ncbi:hypothetical protein Ocin01_12243, partial [Orchesella cincta]